MFMMSLVLSQLYDTGLSSISSTTISEGERVEKRIEERRE